MRLYKLVRVEFKHHSLNITPDKRLVSLTVYAGSGSVEYKQDAVTIPLPGNGPLATFRTEDAALEFGDRNGWTNGRDFHTELWLLDGIKSKAQGRLWISSGASRDILPPGTVLCDAVVLRKFINDYPVL